MLDKAYYKEVDTGLEEPCWVWCKAVNATGYGVIKREGKRHLAHRWQYAIVCGPPGELCVLHRCDNPPCINPAHLFLGTRLDNSRDAARKDRLNQHKTHCPRGHELSVWNIYLPPDGGKVCLICKRASARKWARKNREEQHALRQGG